MTMRLLLAALVWGGGTLAATIPKALAQEAVNIRGTIRSVESAAVRVETRDGAQVTVALPEGVPLSATGPFSLADVKPGMVLGVTTVRRADGATVAIDIRPIPETARQGLSPWDLAPEATMTNAAVSGVVEAASSRSLTLTYPGGTVTALVLPETAMSRAVPGGRDDLKVGEAIFIFARRGADGALTAARVQVGKDGLKPTQ